MLFLPSERPAVEQLVMERLLGSMIEKFNLEAQRHMESQRLNPFSGSFSRSPSPRPSKDYGTPLPGSKTEERGKKAKCHILKEILDLCNCIYDVGCYNEKTRCRDQDESYDPDHDVIVTFKEIFQIYTNINDKVVGLLIAAKKKGFIYFEKEILFQRQDDDVLIALLKPISVIRNTINKELAAQQSPQPTLTTQKESNSSPESDVNKELSHSEITDHKNEGDSHINNSSLVTFENSKAESTSCQQNSENTENVMMSSDSEQVDIHNNVSDNHEQELPNENVNSMNSLNLISSEETLNSSDNNLSECNMASSSTKDLITSPSCIKNDISTEENSFLIPNSEQMKNESEKHNQENISDEDKLIPTTYEVKNDITNVEHAISNNIEADSESGLIVTLTSTLEDCILDPTSTSEKTSELELHIFQDTQCESTSEKQSAETENSNILNIITQISNIHEKEDDLLQPCLLSDSNTSFVPVSEVNESDTERSNENSTDVSNLLETNQLLTDTTHLKENNVSASEEIKGITQDFPVSVDLAQNTELTCTLNSCNTVQQINDGDQNFNSDASCDKEVQLIFNSLN